MERQQILLPVRVLILTMLLVSGSAVAQDGGAQSAAEPAVADLASALAPLGTGFTYQGRLDQNGSPVNDECDMAFRLYDDATGGVQVGSAITATVPITDGLFTVTLDFGAGAFAGDRRWLGIRVDCEGGGTYADLGRQELAAAPQALYAMGAPWSGLAGVPAGFADGVDDDTTYTAGDGLVLDGTEFGVVTGTVQARVNGACAVGSTIRAINADGTVVCQVDAPLNRSLAPTANTLSSLDSTGDVGMLTAMTIGTDGLGLISYYDVSNGDLKVAHCDDAACTTATTTTLDDAGDGATSVVIGADGLGLISYYDVSNDGLKIAHCDNVTCTSVTTTTLDSGGDVRPHNSITIGGDGLGLVSYCKGADEDLVVAHCDDLACTTATTATLDSANRVGLYNSITTGVDGLGLISYKGATFDNLKVAHCANITCTSASITTVDNSADVGTHTSITIGADGLGLISYRDNTSRDLKVAHCQNIACTGATFTTLDAAGEVGTHTSVTIGADGLGLVSYYDNTNGDLKVIHCDNVVCNSASITTVDSADDVGMRSSVTIGTDGLGLISYYDVTNGDLKVAHCSNVFCAPYFRRR